MSYTCDKDSGYRQTDRHGIISVCLDLKRKDQIKILKLFKKNDHKASRIFDSKITYNKDTTNFIHF